MNTDTLPAGTAPAIPDESPDITPVTTTDEASFARSLGAPEAVVKRGSSQPAQTDKLAVDPTTPEHPLEALARHQQKTSRNYEGLDEDEQEIFQKMGNRSYEKLRPIYDAWKKAGGKFDAQSADDLNKLKADLAEAQQQRFHSHPEAFRLTPEYQHVQELTSRVGKVEQFWHEQAAALEDPKATTFNILVSDGKGGLLVQQTPITAESRAIVLTQLMQARADSEKLSHATNALRQQYAAAHQNYTGGLKKLFDTQFGKYRDVLKTDAEKLLATLPPHFRGPDAELVAYSQAALMRMAQALNAQEKTGALRSAQSTARAAGGPTAEEISTGVTAPSNLITPEETRRVIREYGL